MFEEMQMDEGIAFIEPLRLTSAWITILSFALFVLCFWPAVIGKIRLRIYPKVVRLISWAIILAVLIFLLLIVDLVDTHMGVNFSAPDVAYGIITLIIILVIGVHLLLSVRIDKNDLNNREKMLKLECRLVELEEKLNQQQESN